MATTRTYLIKLTLTGDNLPACDDDAGVLDCCLGDLITEGLRPALDRLDVQIDASHVQLAPDGEAPYGPITSL